MATVTDKAGNVAVYTTSLEVAETPDVKAPTIAISPNNNTFHRRDVPLIVTIRDADSLEINWTATLVDNATGQERVIARGDRAAPSVCIETLAVAGGVMDGSYTLRVEAVDKGGNATVATSAFVIDTTPPEVEVVCNRAEVGIRYFDFLVNDATGVKTYRLTVNGKAASVNNDGRAKFTFTEAGEYTVVGTVTDRAGNVTTVTQTLVVGENTDRTGPVVTISPAADAHINKDTTIRVSVADAESDYVAWNARIVMPSGSAFPVRSGTGRVDKQAVYTIDRTKENGPYRIIVEATDAAGNVTIVERTVILDTGYPVLTTNIPDTPDTWNSPIAITGSIEDTGSPTNALAWTLTLSSGVGNPPDGVFCQINPAEFKGGNYRIEMEVVDLAGNKTVRTWGKYIDGTPPIFTASASYDGYKVTFRARGTDDSGGTIHYTIKLISSPNGGAWTFSGDSGAEATGGVILNGASGERVYEVTAWDAAGNCSLPIYLTVVKP